MDRLRRIALATYSQAPNLAPDDRVLLRAFAALDVDAVPAIWTDDDIDWSSFDAVMIRSCWDYHLRLIDFRAWLTNLDEAGMRVWNAPGLVHWNSNKGYLVDLAAKGIPTVPTFVVERGRPEQVGEIVEREGWSRFVLKPAVSASGYETYLLEPSPDAATAVVRVTSLGAALVQPFVAEVGTVGELSFTFIDGLYSHTTIKRPGPGEFRVQTEHGGSVDDIEPSEHLIDGAARVLAALPATPLYARVDGVERNGSFELMELELIEPNLFLEHRNGAAADLAAAAVTRFASR